MVKVELVYVAEDKAVVHLNMEMQQGSTVLDALNQSRIYLDYPETKGLSVGVYAKQVSLETVLKEGDRVELYRPLALDPKEKRRQQAKLGRTRRS